MLSNSSSFKICFTVHQTVVSVGPYTFHNSSTRVNNFFAKLMDNCSPPHKALIGKGLFQPASSNICHLVGVAWSIVIDSFSTHSNSNLPSFAMSLFAITTVAPINSGRYNSSPAMSKEIVDMDKNLSVGSMPGAFIML